MELHGCCHSTDPSCKPDRQPLGASRAAALSNLKLVLVLPLEMGSKCMVTLSRRLSETIRLRRILYPIQENLKTRCSGEDNKSQHLDP